MINEAVPEDFTEKSMVIAEEDDAVIIHFKAGDAIANCKALQVDGEIVLVFDYLQRKGGNVDASVALTSDVEVVFREAGELKRACFT